MKCSSSLSWSSPLSPNLLRELPFQPITLVPCAWVAGSNWDKMRTGGLHQFPTPLLNFFTFSQVTQEARLAVKWPCRLSCAGYYKHANISRGGSRKIQKGVAGTLASYINWEFYQNDTKFQRKKEWSRLPRTHSPPLNPPFTISRHWIELRNKLFYTVVY